jgi:hypothetical protein
MGGAARGPRGGAFGWVTALQTRRLGIWFPIVQSKYFVVLILPAALWPKVVSASNINGYEVYFLGGKGGRCLGLHVPNVLKSGNLNFLEPLEPVHTLTEIALALI